MAQPGSRDDDAVLAFEDRLELGRRLARIEAHEGDLQVEGVIDLRGTTSPRQGAVRQLDRAVRMDPAERRRVQGSERIPAGGVHLADFRAAVNLSEGVVRLFITDRRYIAEV